MCDCDIFRFPRTCGNDGAEARGDRRVERRAGLGDGTRLIRLDEERVACAGSSRIDDARRIRHQEVISHDLHAVADGRGEAPHAGGVALGQRILDGGDGVAVNPADEGFRQTVAVDLPSIETEMVASVPVEGRCGDVERDRHLFTRAPARRLDGPDQLLYRLLVGIERGPPASFVGDTLQASRFRHPSSRRAIHLGRPLQPFGERARAYRHHHHVLNVDPAAGVRAASEDLYLGQRQGGRRATGEVLPEGQPFGRGGGVEDGHRRRD